MKKFTSKQLFTSKLHLVLFTSKRLYNRVKRTMMQKLDKITAAIDTELEYTKQHIAKGSRTKLLEFTWLGTNLKHADNPVVRTVTVCCEYA